MKKLLTYFVSLILISTMIGCEPKSKDNDEVDEITTPVALEGELDQAGSNWTVEQELTCSDELVKSVITKTSLEGGNRFDELTFIGFSELDYTFLRTGSGGIFYTDEENKSIRFEASDMFFPYEFITTLQGEFTVYTHDLENELFIFNSRINQELKDFYDISSVNVVVSGTVHYGFNESSSSFYPTRFEMELNDVTFNNTFLTEEKVFDSCTLSMNFLDFDSTIVSDFPLEYEEELYVNLGPTLVSDRYYEDYLLNSNTEVPEEFGVFFNDNYIFDEVGDTDIIDIYIEKETMFGSYLNGTQEVKIYDENEVEIHHFTHSKNSTFAFTYTLSPGRYTIEIIPLNMAIGEYLGLNVINLTPPDHGQYVFLLGDFDVDVVVGENFVDPGYLVIQTTATVTVTSNVDTNELGQYTVLYEWEYFNEIHSYTRTVNVVTEE